MTGDTLITLVAEVDAETLERTEVFATIESIGQKEFFAAAQVGFKAEYKATVWGSDYEGQTIVEFKEYGQIRRFSVYRKYPRSDEKIELYLSNEIGVHNGN